jgi:ketosteroid isomerase-like protein
MRGDTTMNANELQALALQFADAFDQRDLKTVMEMLSEDVEVFDHGPCRFDGKPLFAKYLNAAVEGASSQRDAASDNHRAACTAILWGS